MKLLAMVKHELRLVFLSPGGWVFLAAFLAIAGLFFQMSLASTGEASLRSVVPNWAVTLVFCVPMITMGQLAGERRAGTDELLFSSPVRLGTVITGKWLAAWCLCSVVLLLTFPMPALLVLYGDPDPGVLLCTYLGLFLCCGGFAAAGLFASSLTSDPMVAGIGGALILLPFWLAGAARDLAPEGARPLLDHLSLTGHLRSFATGVVDGGDVMWFAGFTTTFLFLTWRSVEARRWA